MWKIGFAALVVSMAVCLPAFCEEETTLPRGFAVGVSLGQRAGDVSASINVTSPYIHIKIAPNPHYWGAIRISGDSRIKNATPRGGSADSLMAYYAARLGYVGSIEASNIMRIYAEGGGVALFPTDELASSTTPRFSGYAYLGSEVFIGNNLLTNNTGIFMEIGIDGSTNHRFDKLVNSPIMGWGATASAGLRFYI